MSDKIKVFTKAPGKPPRSAFLPNSLASFQEVVGGYIEAVTIAKDLVIICNEEGKIVCMPYNCTVAGHVLCGDIIIAGVKGDEFADVPLTMAELKELFPRLWPAMSETIGGM